MTAVAVVFDVRYGCGRATVGALSFSASGPPPGDVKAHFERAAAEDVALSLGDDSTIRLQAGLPTGFACYSSRGAPGARR